MMFRNQSTRRVGLLPDLVASISMVTLFAMYAAVSIALSLCLFVLVGLTGSAMSFTDVLSSFVGASGPSRN